MHNPDARQADPGSSQSSPKGDILVVDDTLPNLRALSAMLTEEGYQVRGARDGPTALMIAEGKAPDLVLLDIKMPGMDGYEVCQRLKQDARTCDVPVIFVSGLGEAVDKVKSFAVGGVDYITKPFQVEEVLARVETHLALHSLQKQLEAQNTQLQQEIAERVRAEKALRRAHDELERRVETRTAELAEANVGLRAEIAERKQAEEQLRRERDFNKTLIQASPAFFVTLDADGKTLGMNDAMLYALGYSGDEVIGSDYLTTFVPEKDREILSEVFEGLVRSGEPSVSENWVLTKDGQERLVEWHGRSIFDDKGNLDYFFGLGIDITERKRAEEGQRRALAEALQATYALREERDRAQKYLDIAGVIIIVVGVDQTVTLVNRKGCEILGYEEEEVVGRNWFDRFVPERNRDGVKAVFDQLMTGEIEPVDYFENPVLTKSGEERIIAWHNTVLTDEAGNVIGTLSSGEDITGRKRAEEALRRLHEQVQRHAEELEQQVADRTRELLVLYDIAALASQPLDLETTLAQSLERVLEAVKSDAGAIHLLDEGDVPSLGGSSGDGTLERKMLRLAVRQGIPPDLATQVESLSTGEGLGRWLVERDEPLILPDITSDPRVAVALPIEPHAYIGMPLRASGRILGALSIFRGTSQLQFSVEELSLVTSVADQLGAMVEGARLRKRAEQAAVLEERERLARELHDSVTQSLYSLTLFAEWGQDLFEVGELGAAKQRIIRIGETAHQALKEMRLLVYELRPALLEQDGLAKALQRRLEAVEKRAGVEISLQVGSLGRLPAPVEEGLYRIAQEALNNALKHAAASSVTVRVEVEDDGAQVTLEVEDDGTGFVLDAVSHRGGLGLASMRERARRLGSELVMVSAPGEGTKVAVTVEVS